MDENTRASFLQEMATDLKAQADEAHLELELLKAQIGKRLKPIDQQIEKLKAQKILESSKFEAELNEKEKVAQRKQDTYAHFAVAIGVCFSSQKCHGVTFT
jgi:hypothetical protein